MATSDTPGLWDAHAQLSGFCLCLSHPVVWPLTVYACPSSSEPVLAPYCCLVPCHVTLPYGTMLSMLLPGHFCRGMGHGQFLPSAQGQLLNVCTQKALSLTD